MQQIRRYAVFLSKNRSNYFLFGKQLAISEIAGLVMGVIVAEISTYFLYEKKQISRSIRASQIILLQ